MVNDELHSLNLELARVNTDLVNVLATVEIPIVILDLERRIRRYTPNACKILGVQPSDVGRQIDDLELHIDVRELNLQIANTVESMAVRESEVQDRCGHWYRLQIRPYRTTDDLIDGTILSLVDIDALKQQVRDAQQARRDVERANLAKDQFLATLSHELRSPLASMLIHAQLLIRGGLDDNRLRRVGEAIERGTRLQLRLIEDLLEISRIAAGKLELAMRSVNLPAVVNRALEAARAPAERKSIVIRTTIEASLVRVAGDPMRLQQIVFNLLANAIKFTPESGQVTLTLERADRYARISVSDSGVGMEEGFLAQAFHRFTQEDGSNTRAHGGLGLGLAIVHHLVELHGGTVGAESPGKGKGASFTVTLPLIGGQENVTAASDAVSSPPPGTHRPAARGDGALRDVVVLVFDDDREVRDAVAEMLQQRGARVTIATSTEEAMAAIEGARPDVLVCDITMPGEDGLSFIRRLRTLGAARGGATKALALTALAGDEDRMRALAAGFQLFLPKPVEIERLVEAVAALHEGAPGPATGRSGPRPRPSRDDV